MAVGVPQSQPGQMGGAGAGYEELTPLVMQLSEPDKVRLYVFCKYVCIRGGVRGVCMWLVASPRTGLDCLHSVEWWCTPPDMSARAPHSPTKWTACAELTNIPHPTPYISRKTRQRETALMELSKKREVFPDLAPILWHTVGTMAALLQVRWLT